MIYYRMLELSVCRSKVVIAVILLYAAFSTLCSAYSHAEGHLPGALTGSPFSDPLYVQEMGKEWEQKPIVHDASAGKIDMVVSLDQQMYPALKPIIEDYAKKNGIKILVKDGTCGISAGMLSSKSVDIGGFCCSPGRTDRLPGLRFHTIGIAAIALIVHPENPITNLSIDEARGLFMGDYFRWQELPAIRNKASFHQSVKPIARLHCKLRAGSWHMLLKNEDLFSPDLVEVGAIPDMISQVAGNKEAIGYETLWVTRYFQSRGAVKPVRIDGYAPDNRSSLMSGKYPIYRTYNLTTWEGEGVKHSHALGLVQYVLKAVDRLNDRYNLIPASTLRKNGWTFKGNELVGEPDEG